MIDVQKLKNGKSVKVTFYSPIEQFTSQEQLDTSLKEWQHKLGLDDWIIKAVLVDKCSDEEYGTSGLCTRLPIQKAALIEIKKEYGGAISEKCELGEIHIAKQPHELCLVHELCHMVLGLLENREGTFEAQTTGVIEHQRVELFAKALIMAKYGLTLEWFKV